MGGPLVMAWQNRRRFHRVFINDELVRIAGPVTGGDALGQLVSTCSFQMISRPEGEPAEGDPVRVEWLDIDNDTMYVQFVGTVDSCDVDSSPHRYVIIAADQLEAARRVRSGADLTLSGGGATDKDAWVEMADHIGATYDDADIADAGLVLGERVPVKWLADESTSAGQMILALDDVTGMVTKVLPDGRLVRFPYENVPDGATGSSRTYTKGEDLTLFRNKRTKGGRDQIQTRWSVRGVTYDSANGSCTSQPWAKAVSGNAVIGRRTSLAPGEFQSDLIQDEAHAEAMVRRLIGATNKSPDTFTAEVMNDPRIFSGLKIAIVDETYGIGTGGLKHFTIASVDRNGAMMTLTLIGGPPGSAGTVTTGVEKICGDAHTDVDWPGDFEMPPFDPPTLDGGTEPIIEPIPEPIGDDDGGTEEDRYHGPIIEFSDVIIPDAPDWIIDVGSPFISSGQITATDLFSVTLDRELDPAKLITIRGNVAVSWENPGGATPFFVVFLHDSIVDGGGTVFATALYFPDDSPDGVVPGEPGILLTRWDGTDTSDALDYVTGVSTSSFAFSVTWNPLGDLLTATWADQEAATDLTTPPSGPVWLHLGVNFESSPAPSITITAIEIETEEP